MSSGEALPTTPRPRTVPEDERDPPVVRGRPAPWCDRGVRPADWRAAPCPRPRPVRRPDPGHAPVPRGDGRPRAVVSGDFRYAPKDRTAYLAYPEDALRESSNLNAWRAQREYCTWLLRQVTRPPSWSSTRSSPSTPTRCCSRSSARTRETYAKLGVDLDAFEAAGSPTFGTTNVDFGQALFQGSSRCGATAGPTSYRPGGREVRHRSAGRGAGEGDRGAGLLAPAGVPPGAVVGRPAAATGVPRWRRSSSTSALRHLPRMHADRRGQRRGLRVELVPGEPPRLVLEPWNTVIPASAGDFKGKASPEVWPSSGAAARLTALPTAVPAVRPAEEVEVHILGSGLPRLPGCSGARGCP